MRRRCRWSPPAPPARSGWHAEGWSQRPAWRRLQAADSSRLRPWPGWWPWPWPCVPQWSLWLAGNPPKPWLRQLPPSWQGRLLQASPPWRSLWRRLACRRCWPVPRTSSPPWPALPQAPGVPRHCCWPLRHCLWSWLQRLRAWLPGLLACRSWLQRLRAWLPGLLACRSWLQRLRAWLPGLLACRSWLQRLRAWLPGLLACRSWLQRLRAWLPGLLACRSWLQRLRAWLPGLLACRSWLQRLRAWLPGLPGLPAFPSWHSLRQRA